ncbi:MAG: fibronectin-binding domain-containing protein, partial [Gemmatimonadetes bacterium]|nr:fibronectin-binding domain-containing protein [Gemmatimonadota bacterium]NIU31325.1 fibronectin-binding domain-containing protein [Gemmatimonadota bacterium]NIV61678.1 fibronectin-binding domain-containing protein [Gemmatimonadota bacterium]NIW64391.1 fibronectin-binding domain-containing protein [Gemmatimonadota bacterium]
RPEALRRLDELLSQAVRRVGSLQRQLETSADPGALRSTGDLLLARLAEVERGKETVVLEDFDGSAREIALDPLRSPQDNAADYYERATKAERARARIPELI